MHSPVLCGPAVPGTEDQYRSSPQNVVRLSLNTKFEAIAFCSHGLLLHVFTHYLKLWPYLHQHRVACGDKPREKYQPNLHPLSALWELSSAQSKTSILGFTLLSAGFWPQRAAVLSEKTQ